MTVLRAFLDCHRVLALWLVAAAICMRAAVPAGYMVSSESKVLTISVCLDSLDHQGLARIVVPMKGKAGSMAKGECAFSSLAMAATSGADPVLLGLALAWILLLGFVPAPPARARPLCRLRPPLRGPPART